MNYRELENLVKIRIKEAFALLQQNPFDVDREL